jgi:signal transduction histidine kinase
MNLSTVLTHPLVTSLLNLSQTPILITDRFTTEILFANAASTQLFGKDYTSRKLDDDLKHFFRPLTLDGQPITDRQQHPAIQVQRSGSLETEIKWSTPTGIRDLKVVAASLSEAIEGRFLTVISITDITDIKSANRRLISELSHEVKNPISVILGFADLISEESGSLDAETKESLKIIRRNAAHVIEVVENQLKDAKSSENEISDFKFFDLEEICVEIVRSTSLLAEKKQIPVKLDIDVAETTVFGSERAVRQILLNLISNAMKFTESGSISLRLFSLKPDMLAIDIRDSGTGIDPKFTEKLFSPFSQAHTEKQFRSKGSGMGLNIVRGLARSLGGDVTLNQTELGVGSTFRLEIPTAQTTRI